MKRHTYTTLAIFVLLLMTTGCITPRYKSPAVSQTLSSYRNATADTTTIAAIDWRDFYKDTKLQQLIYQALDSNLNIRMAIKQIEQSKAYFKQSRAAIAPRFNLAAQGSLLSPSEVGTTAIPSEIKLPIDNYSLALSASWEIDVWGKLRSAKKAALADLLAQQATKNAVTTEIVSGIASGYYQLLMLDAQKRIAQQTIVNYTEYLNTIKQLKESAKASEVAVQQAYAQLYGVLAYLPQVEASIEITENYLCLLMGKQGAVIERASNFNTNAISSELLIGVPTQLLQYRPDVMVAENKLRASHENFNVARASMYPALTLSGAYGSESVGIKNWFSPESLFWNAVGGLTQPLFNARALKTQKEVSKLQNEQALLSFRQTLLNCANEVSTALLKSKSGEQQALYQQKQYESINKAYLFSKELLVQGFANTTYLDVLAAQSTLFSTEISLYTTYYEVLNQKIELYRALGGGWQ